MVLIQEIKNIILCTLLWHFCHLFFELKPMWVISTFEKNTFRWKPVLLNGLEFRTSCFTLWIDHNEIKYSRKTLVTRYSTKGSLINDVTSFSCLFDPSLSPFHQFLKILWWSAFGLRFLTCLTWRIHISILPSKCI